MLSQYPWTCAAAADARPAGGRELGSGGRIGRDEVAGVDAVIQGRHDRRRLPVVEDRGLGGVGDGELQLPEHSHRRIVGGLRRVEAGLVDRCGVAHRVGLAERDRQVATGHALEERVGEGVDGFVGSDLEARATNADLEDGRALGFHRRGETAGGSLGEHDAGDDEIGGQVCSSVCGAEAVEELLARVVDEIIGDRQDLAGHRRIDRQLLDVGRTGLDRRLAQTDQTVDCGSSAGLDLGGGRGRVGAPSDASLVHAPAMSARPRKELTRTRRRAR